MASPTPIVTEAIAGPFKAFYAQPTSGSLTYYTLGVIGSRGIRQLRRPEIEEYSVDLAGNSIVEGTYLGGQVFLEFDLEEANITAVKDICNQFKLTPPTAGATNVADQGNEMGIPGTFVTDKAGSIMLMPMFSATGTVHTTAGAETTPVRTYGLVAMAAGFEHESLYSSKRRVHPIRLRCYPYSDGGSPAKYIWYTLGALDGTYRIV